MASSITYSTYQLDDGKMQEMANWTKRLILIRLEKDGLLTKPAVEISREYQLVIVKKGWFGQLVDKIFGLTAESDGFHFIVMKIAADEFEADNE